ncbi:GH92 family glycosyl hydrolase [Kribbella sindirgiensis]|uniref:Glycoside hydrolase family 92 protein n=1 Tax=Kribbella sindirgiensis TaxID=1124744 RepID=A0A4R0J477_9ACTN|nr:GH92 family glycosyl hydrolase [Kribbella sindirgiensis]TCC39944.1 glycoside hydrolase family 92 protein [Kribbella sindirgiensis]
MIVRGGGPGGATSSRAGFSGVDGTRYSGTSGGRQVVPLPGGDRVVAAGDRLRYKVYPELDAGLSYSATYVAVEVVFADGAGLDGARDQYGKAADAAGQGAAKILYAGQWNDVQVDLTAAAGRTVEQVVLVVDAPEAGHEFVGWIDDVEIGPAPAEPDGTDLAAYVDTRRGTNASHDFSRGNTLPITAWPNGFNFLTPVTNASTHRWPYEYHRANNADNRPELQGLTFSHQPSPWMGDRDQLTIMPVAAAEPLGDPAERAAAFSHDDETARPDLYAVDLANGVRAELTPTDHGAIFRFTFPRDAAGRHLIFDTIDEHGAFSYDGNAITGWVENGSETGRTRMYCYGEFSTAPIAFGAAHGGRANARAATFDVPEVTLRIATSFIGVDQARHNLELELAGRSFEEIQAAANAVWNERLQVIRPEGATPPQLRTVYGNLYRLNLYPNSHFENAGTPDAPEYRYASPVLPTSGDPTERDTNAVVKSGKMYVNSGFWDTYRTAWPAYAFFYPALTAELVDGFVQQYRDGGWIARWSSPGYADCMTGTSSDVSFADAYLKGVTLPDPLATYDAGLRNATVAPSETEVGRKGIETGIFAGYVSTDTEESVSWSLEAYLNDFALAEMATRLADEHPERRDQLLEEAEYLRRRSLNYVLLFDNSVNFFQGRRADGSFAKTAADFDPEEWGGDFTETDGWNFAFHVAHDPRGLANLYGGPRGLEAKLDAFFATPELAVKKGTYSIVIHEMLEAQAVRMGQFGFSNQPAHHIAWMYNYTGTPAKTQAIAREVLDRLYVGEQIGQGYPGDEDNGEMSAWYLFAALGLYPLRVGAPEYAIGSPLFPRVLVSPLGGRPLTITASGAEHPYVQDLQVDGKQLSVASITHADLTAADQLHFTLGAEPSDWATLELPPALTSNDAVARPLVDLIPVDPSNPLLDDTSATETTLERVAWTLPAPATPTLYTLTSGSADAPSAWQLEASTDGTTWTLLDERTNQTFRWSRQTRPFTIKTPGEYQHYRLTTPTPATLAQLELLH